MRICIANTQVLNPMIGGVERVSTLLTREWKQYGVYIIFLSQYSSVYSEEYESAAPQYILPNSETANTEENVKYFSSLIANHHIEVVLNQAANVPDFSALCFEVKKATTIKLVSAFHFSPNYQSEAIRNNFFLFEGLKYNGLLWFREIIKYMYYTLYKFSYLKKYEKNYYKGIYNQSEVMVLLSQNYIPEFERLLEISNGEKLKAINNPLEFSEINLGHRKKQVLYVGRIEYGLKRIDRLISIWSEIAFEYPNWSLKIVGNGPYRGKIENGVIKRKIPGIYFEGFQDPLRYYAESPVICLTSTNEGFGIVLAEAQQYGCVPVAYDSFGSLKDIIKDGENGFLIPPFNKKIYIQRLRQLMDDEVLREKMSLRAKQTCKKFDVKVIAQEWLNLFNKINDHE